tara:strand:+ start:516 stop:1268 length:753 start_codon:yes stop_codon:yes gene_type:complete
MFYSKKLKKFKEINHCFFSRNGGVSKGLYRSLNCGRGSKDKKQNLIKNLKIVSKKMKVKSKNIILMYQTHSSKVVEINKYNVKKQVNSDSIITKIKGFALGVVTADCVPILLFDYKNKIVGCVHAGWKGAFKGIIKNTISKIRSVSPNNQIYACIGPCIGKKSYEVDIEFYKKFILKSKKNKRYFFTKSEHKKLFDLRKFVTDKLIEQKVKVDHVNYDTFTESRNFFSYRRSSILKDKDYGRCISLIKLN